jgi:hypothetical protein
VVFVDSSAAATLTECTITDATVTSTQLGSVSDTRGGVVFVADNATATLFACSIARASVVATSGLAHGGVMSIGAHAQGKLSNCTIASAVATSTSGSAQGSVVGLSQGATIDIGGCNISHAVATSTSGDADGGVVHVGASANVTMVSSNITNAAATSIAGRARGGMMEVSEYADVSLTSCRITDVTARAMEDALGGCLMLRNAIVRLAGTRLQSCAAQSHARRGEGGAAYVSSAAQLIMSSGVLLLDNAASTSGQTVKLIAASAVYVLPAPPGRWVSGSRCIVNRAACDPNGPERESCESAEASCSLLTGDQPVASSPAGDITCMPRLAERFQRCDYTNLQLLNQLIETLAEGALDNNYPYDCTVARHDHSLSYQVFSDHKLTLLWLS